MHQELLEILRCPESGERLEVEAASYESGRIREGWLIARKSEKRYPVRNFIPRFVPAENYASNFGMQWNRFKATQLDSHSGFSISSDRFYASTGWGRRSIAGKRVLDVGCGAGRFAEVALEARARVVAVDYSSAVEAAQDNLRHHGNIDVIQASIFDLPFASESFDLVYCLGVLQHTPNPENAFQALPKQIRSGGQVAVDIYPFLLRNVFWSKYWLRPFAKRINNDTLLAMVERYVPAMLKISRVVSSLPVIGPKLKYMLPVANYAGVYPLSEHQLEEWAILDTFDMFSPEHDHPKSASTLRRWLIEAGLTDIEVFKKGHLIGRGRKPAAHPATE